MEVVLEGVGARQSAIARFGFSLTAQDREDVRWYLEDYLQYPAEPAPQIADRVEGRLAELGAELFAEVFEGSRDTLRLWDAVAGSLADTRVEVDPGVEGEAAVPWELLRDPATDGVLALRARAFVRIQPQVARPPALPAGATGTLRVLLVICRPAGRTDVPFRSVASHLVRLSREAREMFQLDVLRPPTFTELTRALGAARAAGSPYHVVHFDGHGAYLDATIAATALETSAVGLDRNAFSLVSPPRPGPHGYLVFEDPRGGGNQQLVDGPALANLLVDAGVPVLVLNACRSAHADLVPAPEEAAGLDLDAHRRVRAYGSLAQEVMDAGVAGVVAMRYNVYVMTAARFIGEVYAGLLEGRQLGGAVNAARRQLAANPLRDVGGMPRSLQDWVVPVVFEAAPLALLTASEAPRLEVDLSQAEAGRERAQLDPGLPAGPGAGFFGRDETLLALDRAFDTGRVVLLQAWAGAGKTSTALEFARWYALTGAVSDVLFTSFAQHLSLPRLVDQVGDRFAPALAAAGVEWAALGEDERRYYALQVLAQVPVLWVWDNVEPVAGFPADCLSAWTTAEQQELAAFLRELAEGSRCRVLLTSRREERGWLGDLPVRVSLPAMPMLERLELARAVAARQPSSSQRFLQVADWRPLLEFAQGNPMTVTILTRQVVREHRTTREQIEAFVAGLRGGAAELTDDPAQGRDASLAASLGYGLSQAFTETERAVLALLALFQGFVGIEVLRSMGNPEIVGSPIPAVAGLNRRAGVALLDRAAEVGLLTESGGGYYAVHPAVPWYLQHLFQEHYGPPGSPPAIAAIRAWTLAISAFGDYYHNEYDAGHRGAIDILRAEEANLLWSFQLARDHSWWDLVMGPIQGLRTLYGQTGRAIEWRRLVTGLAPYLADPVTGGPIPGREQQWALLTEYRVRFVMQAQDWPAAEELQQALIVWHREQATDALAALPGALSYSQRMHIRNLAAAIESLGHILREQERPGCVEQYLEAARLSQRIRDRYQEGVIAFNLGHAYFRVPGMRDLDRAEYWHRRASELRGDDAHSRAQSAGELGAIAFARYQEAKDARHTKAQLDRHLSNAMDAYQQALALHPSDALDDLAVTRFKLGMIYAEKGEASRALTYFRQAIEYRAGQEDRYNAGLIRLTAAGYLLNAGCRDDAFLYTQAAMRDFETVGPGAAALARLAQQLIGRLQEDTR